VFPGRNNAARARTKPPLVLKKKGADKKKELDEIAAQTLRRVIDNVDNQLELDKLDSFQKKQFNEQIYDTLIALLEEEERYLSQGDKQKVIQYVSDEIFGYGPITALLQDPGVTEIMVNGYANVYAEREGKISKTEITFRDNNHVLHVINKIITPLGRRIDESSPTVDARLPDGSRVNAIIPPLALNGPSLTIRKFAADPFTADDLITFGTMSAEMARFLAACVRSRVNIVVSGGTGSGKTTTLNVLSSFIPDNERIVTIEDTAELQLQQDHLVTLESRPANIEGKGQFTIRELVINSLRMRPDRIIVGEVRGGEAFDMLQAMNTGHDGSISTLHANNPQDALARLETMILMAGIELPLRAIREQISSAIELVVQQSRFSDGSRKITKISEVVGLKKEKLVVKDIFVFQQSSIDEEGRVSGEHRFTGVVPRCLEKLKARGESIAADGTMNWGRQEEAASAAERDSVEQLQEEETKEAGLDLEFMEPGDVAEQDEQKDSSEGYLGDHAVGESFGGDFASLQNEAPQDSQDLPDDDDSKVDDEEKRLVQENEANKGGEAEEKRPASLLDARGLVIKAVTAPLQETVTAVETPSRKIGFLADISNNTFYGLKSALSGKGEVQQPATDLTKVAAVMDTADAVGVTYVTGAAEATAVTDTAGAVDMEDVTDERFIPHQEESGQVSTAVEIADDEPVIEEEREHQPVDMVEEEWEKEPVTGEESKNIPHAGEEGESELLTGEENKAKTIVAESTGEPVAVKEEKTGAIVRERENEPDAEGEEKTVSTVSEAEEKNAWPAAPTGVASRKGEERRGLAASIPPSRRGIALLVNEIGGLYDYLYPGDRVDVLVIYHNQAAHEQQAARTVAQSAVVLAIRERSSKSGAEKGAALFSVILAVTPAQAEVLAYASFRGSFYLTLCPDLPSTTQVAAEE
jgi:pilus assembly protein CpaF